VLSVGFTAALAATAVNSQDIMAEMVKTSPVPSVAPLELSLSAVGMIAAVLLPVFGVLTVTSEYSTGSIRSTMAAVPRRLSLLGSKALVVALVSLVGAVVVGALSFAASWAVFASHSYDVSLAAPGWRLGLGLGLFAVIMGLAGVGVGAALRSSAGAIAATLGIVLGAPMVLGFFMRYHWAVEVSKFLPFQLGSELTAQVANSVPGGFAGAAGFLALWAAVPLVAAVVAIRSKDA
jgi:ABC-2 type transport system permease protein